MNLSDKIRSLREKHNLTQREFAKKLFVTHQAVSRWERGETYPQTEVLISISKIYNISLDELVFGEDKYDDKFTDIKINGLKYNILVLLLVVPTIVIIIFLKYNLQDNVIQLYNVFELFTDSLINLAWWLFLFSIIYIGGVISHELLRMRILIQYGVPKRSLRFKLKNHMFFLYCSEKLTIKQAKRSWIIPFIFYCVLAFIAFLLLDIFLTIAFVCLILTISDDLVMYKYLKIYEDNDMFIQRDDCLGFQYKKNI